MIAADSSAWIDFFKGTAGSATSLLNRSLAASEIVIPLHVLFELLSSPGLSQAAARLVRRVPTLELKNGYWERAAEMRRGLLRRRLRARSIDCLIAQSCIDQGVPLITGDYDFRHFTRFGLLLL